MLRLAIILAEQNSVDICAPVHDALLVEASQEIIQEVVITTQNQMGRASELVLPDFSLRTDAKIVRYPDRYFDDRGRKMWDTVWSILGRVADGTCLDPEQAPATL